LASIGYTTKPDCSFITVWCSSSLVLTFVRRLFIKPLAGGYAALLIKLAPGAMKRREAKD
jgi:hypothetical protein